MHKNILLIFVLLLFSCKKDPVPPPPEDGSTNCATIHIRKDSDNSFYEVNTPYQDIENNKYKWKFTNFQNANIDSSIFSSGINSIKNHSTLLSVLLIRNDKIVYEQYFHSGSKDLSTNIHSASKSIISALIGIAIEKNIIAGVDQKLVDFFPDYISNNAWKKEMRIKDLLTMTAGLKWKENYTEYSIEKSGNWLKSILKLPMADSPSTVFHYSTANTHILSAVLQEATEINNCEFLYTNLMSDLGIVVEHWGRDPQGYYSGGYNFYITPRELAQFGLLYLNHGKLDSNQIIPSNWVDACLTEHVKADATYDYGYCWWITTISGHKVYKAWGYGGQYICLIPDFDIELVSTANTNGEYDQLDIDEFIKDYMIPAVK